MSNLPSSSLVCYVLNGRAAIVGQSRHANLDALAAWLVSVNAEHCGRLGFLVQHAGESCRVAIAWEDTRVFLSWRGVEQKILPLFTRARRLDAIPRLQPIRKSPSRACAISAQSHQLFPTRFDVASGAERFTVTVAPGRSPSIACTCADGQEQAGRGRNARCSHATAVLAELQKPPAAA